MRRTLLLLPDGDTIKTLRKSKGMSQRELCDLANIAPKTLRRMEKSNHVQRKPVIRVAAVLGCDAQSLAIPKGRLLSVRQLGAA